MPLIIMTGLPCSGKTTRTVALKNFFEKNCKKFVKVVSEEEIFTKAGYDRNTYFADSKNEKSIRSELKSIVQRLLNSDDVLILDGSNYIKGYRYELYCMTKLYKTPQCTIQCEIPAEHGWLWNESRQVSEQYSRQIFDELTMRYEAPDNKNRWDSPLFIVTPDDDINYEDVRKALYDVNAPKPNMSTQCVPLSSTNYLYQLDKITQDIINAILSAKQIGIENDIKVPGCNILIQNSCHPPILHKLRRQFLTYSKMQQSDINQIAGLFVQYLNKSI